MTGNVPPRRGGASRGNLLPPAFLLLIFALVRLDLLPFLVLCLYPPLSLITFFVYALDKRAARDNRRRISEKALHLASLFGGWPGAALAQRLLRHKSQKAAFRRLYRLTVLANCSFIALLGFLWAGWRLPQP